ncbi:MAG: ATP-binding cassette domain-containing protein [bacterium]|nr:ATP-binding cassette domain-containing protein [bacterium]
MRFAYGANKKKRKAPGEPVVLDVPEFRMQRGERVFLHGPSGSGKTTLLGLLGGVLDIPAGGRVGVLGQDLATLSSAARDAFRGSHMGYIFQMFNLIPYLSVVENITLPCRLNADRRARLKGREASEVAQELADHLGIADYLNSPVTRLSVGQQQRVAAARALIGDPELIIADEPTSALDTDRRENFIELLFQRCQASGASVLFVSHDHGLRSLFDRDVSLAEINQARSTEVSV